MATNMYNKEGVNIGRLAAAPFTPPLPVPPDALAIYNKAGEVMGYQDNSGGGGSGDMLKSVYDVANTGRVDGSDTIPTETYLDGQIIKYDLASGKMIGSSLIPLVEEVLLQQSSTAGAQQPNSLNSPIRIEFGTASGTPSDPVMIDATGLITFNQGGAYFIKISVQYGRGTTNGEVELYTRTLVNNTQIGNSAFARLDDRNTNIPTSERVFLTLSATDTLEFELIRDSSLGGINNGGLFRGNPDTSGWENAPTASISISRLSGDAVSVVAGGDVIGTTASEINEVTTYSDITGKNIKGGSDVSIVDGVIEKITPDTRLWLKSNTNNEQVIIGRHDDLTGVPNLSNTTAIITSQSTNDIVFATTGNNSQNISFVKQGTFRGQLTNNK